MEEIQIISLKKDEILFLAEELGNDLFIIQKGKVMVFVQKGSEIIPVSYLSTGEYIGEFSFFDDYPRSASIMCAEDTEFVKIKADVMHENFPAWLKILGLQLTKKIRQGDELIRSKGIRKKNLDSIRPLTIGEQTRCFKLVELHKSKLK